MSAADKSVMHVRFSGLLGSFGLDVKFKAPMRGITALFGPSGSGKTTVLRCIAGLNRLAGELRVGGEIWQNDSGIFRPSYERAIGYVFQEPSLFPHLSVRRNMLYGRSRALKNGAAEEIRFEEVVRLVGIDSLLDRTTADLSGGERQRVAIGRALLSQPRLLLMDEPLAALDHKSKEEILPFFETLHETLSMPILYVTHDMVEVERLADTLVLLEAGKVLATGPLSDMLADPHLPIARRIEAATVLAGRVKCFDQEYQLTEIEVNGQVLLAPGQVGHPGKPLRVRIAAADVSLAPDRPSRTSILNVLQGRIKDARAIDESQMNVVLTVGNADSGPALLARISRRAWQTLRFAPGQAVYAQVKAVRLMELGDSRLRENPTPSSH